jgi:predicted nucleotidyltransferase
VFGSLARGNWDTYSDLDLDIVLEDGVAVEMAAELRRLCEALEMVGERAAVILPKRADEGDVVCVSPLELSVASIHLPPPVQASSRACVCFGAGLHLKRSP